MKITIILFIISFCIISCERNVKTSDKTSLNNKPADFKLDDTTKMRLKNEFIDFYKEFSANFDQKKADSLSELFLQDFEKAKNKYGDSLTYFSDFYLSFGNVFPDTNNIKKDN